MANANAVPSPDPLMPTGQAGDGLYKVIGAIAVDANPAVYVTGGITLNFLQSAIKAQRTPLRVAVSGTGGFVYSYVKGSDASNGKLKIFVQDAVAANPLAEIAAAGIPAGVSGDTITFEAYFRGQL